MSADVMNHGTHVCSRAYHVVVEVAQAILEVILVIVIVRGHDREVQVHSLVRPAFRDVEQITRLQEGLVRHHAVEVGVLLEVRHQDVCGEEFRLEVILVGGVGPPVVGGRDEADELRAAELQDPETSHLGCITGATVRRVLYRSSGSSKGRPADAQEYVMRTLASAAELCYCKGHTQCRMYRTFRRLTLRKLQTAHA